MTTVGSGRIMALDVGDARIGVAVSDPTRLIARPLAVVKRSAGQPVGRIAALAREQDVAVIVLGLPLNMDGSQGEQARRVLVFRRRLAEVVPHTPLETWDERMSSQEAAEIRCATTSKKKRRTQPDDAVAAAVILQSYLDARRAATPSARTTMHGEEQP